MLRLPDGMRDRIKAAADEQSRSMNAQIVHMLQYYLDRIDLEDMEVNIEKEKKNKAFLLKALDDANWSLGAKFDSKRADHNASLIARKLVELLSDDETLNRLRAGIGNFDTKTDSQLAKLSREESVESIVESTGKSRTPTTPRVNAPKRGLGSKPKPPEK